MYTAKAIEIERKKLRKIIDSGGPGVGCAERMLLKLTDVNRVETVAEAVAWDRKAAVVGASSAWDWANAKALAEQQKR